MLYWKIIRIFLSNRSCVEIWLTAYPAWECFSEIKAADSPKRIGETNLPVSPIKQLRLLACIWILQNTTHNPQPTTATLARHKPQEHFPFAIRISVPYTKQPVQIEVMSNLKRNPSSNSLVTIMLKILLVSVTWVCTSGEVSLLYWKQA